MPLSHVFLIALLLLHAPANAVAAPIQPEPDSGWQPKQPAQGGNVMVAAAHPAAVQAGITILRQGGNALDAAVATQMALNVAEPQASGIGGGGFLIYYDAQTRTVSTYDGRETAPAALPETAFLDAQGQPLPFLQAVRGGRSVGVPGLLHMLNTAHTRHGGLAWAELFSPAIALAEKGIATSPRLQRTIDYAKHLHGLPDFDHAFLQQDGSALAIDEARPNPELAASFRRIAEDGIEIFYTGALGQAMVTAVEKTTANPGYLRMNDLAAYKTRTGDAPCLPYRQFTVCSFGPPAGGLTVLQTLGILSHFHLSAKPSAASFHLLLEAERLAQADREQYVADPLFVDVPVHALLSPEYLAGRAKLIRIHSAMPEAMPGRVEAHAAFYLFPPSAMEERPSTTHISIVDAQGNAAALTSSIEHSFGSGLVAGGFLLNNQLTDFSFLPRAGGHALPNRIEPGKRPRSAMSPTLVFDDTGKLRLVIGSPGGARIIPYVVQALVGVLDWKLPLQEALEAPHVLVMKNVVELEAGHDLESLGRELESYGHTVKFTPLTSGLHAVQIGADGALTGAADPRRDGIAEGY